MRLIILFLITFFPLITFAQNPIEFVKKYCNINIPELAISQCLQGIYNLGVALAVLVAFFVFIFGAFKNLLSVVPDVKMEGKTMMRNAVIGLVVIFISGTILYWINPFIFNPVIIVYKITSDVLWEIGRGTEKSGLPEVEGTGVNPSSSGIQHGKPLIKQGDPQWAEIPYKNPNCGDESQTIKSSGCGIASLAMAIAYYNSTSEREYKNLITTLANDAVYELKVRTCNNGTAWSIYTNNKYLKKWNVSGKAIGKDINYAIQALKENKIVIASMGGRSIFTIRGHYIVLVGYNETEKKFLINDPGPRDVREASVNEFKDHVKSMWVIEGISR